MIFLDCAFELCKYLYDSMTCQVIFNFITEYVLSQCTVDHEYCKINLLSLFILYILQRFDGSSVWHNTSNIVKYCN